MTVRIAFCARDRAMVREIQKRPLERVDVPRQLAADRVLNGSRGFAEIAARHAIAEAASDTADPGVDRQHGVIGGKEEHPMRSAFSASSSPSSALTRAAAALIRPSHCATEAGIGSPETGKFTTAFDVSAPQSSRGKVCSLTV